MQWAWRPSADRDTITDAPSSTALAKVSGAGRNLRTMRGSAPIRTSRLLPGVGERGTGASRHTDRPVRHGTEWSSYQPQTRSWPFQLIEAGCLLALSAVPIGAALWLVARRRADPGARPDPACADGHGEAGTPRQGPQRWAGCQPAWRATVTPSGDWKWQTTEGRRLGYKKPIGARHVQARDHQLLREVEPEAGLRRGQLPG